MSDEKPALWERIRALPDAPDMLLVLAARFEEAANGFYADPQTVDVKQFVGAFARCRMAWCAHTGEPLV